MRHDRAIKLDVIKRRQAGAGLGEITNAYPDIPRRTLCQWIEPVVVETGICIRKKQNVINGNTIKFAAIRLDSQKQGRLFVKNNPATKALLGAALYWAEGTKHRTKFGFANCDVEMHKAMWAALQATHPDFKKFVKFHLHIHEGNSLEKAKDFWSRALQHPVDFRYIHTAQVKSCATKWPHGVLTILVERSAVIQFYYGMIQELFGLPDNYFER